MLCEIGAFEAKNTLGSLLDRVAKGDEVLITRHGKAVARMVSATPAFDRSTARQAPPARHRGAAPPFGRLDVQPADQTRH